MKTYSEINIEKHILFTTKSVPQIYQNMLPNISRQCNVGLFPSQVSIIRT
uniref:Uncharacterized protein n=1 Tax=Anguilla anguilla TaxID=7936 RepID=A0A0E9XWK4_ANGAN